MFWIKFVILYCSRTNSDIKTSFSGTVMQTSLIVVSITICSGTSRVDQIDILRSFNGSSSALFRTDRWGRATK